MPKKFPAGKRKKGKLRRKRKHKKKKGGFSK
jgi:hypothetical protein